MRMRRCALVLGAVLVVLGATSSPARGQQEIGDLDSAAVLLRVFTPNAHTYRIAVRPGGMAVVENLQTRETLGLRPTKVDLLKNEVSIEVLRLEGSAEAPTASHLQRVLRAQIGFAELAVLDGLFEIEVEGLRTAVGPRADGIRSKRPKDPGIIFEEQCCLTCGGNRVCGCAVGGSCGTCCSACCAI